ncbi:hypothetical protein [Comamonas endophytica]|nr:hypothetical protein [Acidovorax sp. D4N7]
MSYALEEPVDFTGTGGPAAIDARQTSVRRTIDACNDLRNPGFP